MEAFALYVVFSVMGVAAARRLRRALRDASPLQPYGREATSAIICVLGLLYVCLYPALVIRGDAESVWHWLLQATLPWAVVTLGLPLVLPKLWAATVAGLQHPVGQAALALGTAILSYIVFTYAQTVADQAIMGLVQTHPGQLAGGHRLLTAGVALYGWVVVLFLMSFIALVAALVAERRTGGRVLSFTTLFTLTFALHFVPLSVVRALPGPWPSTARLQEWAILTGSFLPNEVIGSARPGEGGSVIQHGRLACRDLPPDAYIAFVHPDEPVPDKVIAAEPKAGPVPEGASAYRYRLARCDNAINPDKVE